MDQLPVYFINLDSRADRRAFMDRQFDRLGIAATRIPALTPDDVTAEQRALSLDPDNPWAISMNALACALSHRHAWQLIAEADQEAALVLEDDVTLHPSLASYLHPDVLDRAGTRLLHLETFRRRVRTGSRALGEIAGDAVRHLLTTHPGAAAYVVGRDIAIASLTDPSAMTMEVDRYLFGRGGRWLHEVPIGQPMVVPCVQLMHQRDAEAAGVAKSSIGTSPPVPRSATGEAARRHLNNRYVGRLAMAFLADPVALLTPPAPVRFAGDD
jgi:glycosyl transferase, family 25